MKPSFYNREQNSIRDQVQLWTSRINKLNNLLVQLDSPFVQDVLKNLARNRSPYLAAFLDIKIEITRVSFLLQFFREDSRLPLGCDKRREEPVLRQYIISMDLSNQFQ